MRRNIRSAIHDYLQQVKLTAPGSYANVAAVETWDNDEWTFGQVLSMSLWFPALLEMFYSMIGKLFIPWHGRNRTNSSCFQPETSEHSRERFLGPGKQLCLMTRLLLRRTRVIQRRLHMKW